MGVLLCLKVLEENHSYKYFLLKRLPVTYRPKRVQGLCKHKFPIYNTQHAVQWVAADSLFEVFPQVIPVLIRATLLTGQCQRVYLSCMHVASRFIVLGSSELILYWLPSLKQYFNTNTMFSGCGWEALISARVCVKEGAGSNTSAMN